MIHTNLGRAPLADAAIERIASIARGYTNLEYDLATGARGSRTVHAESLITSIDRRRSRHRRQQQRRRHLLILSGLAAGREVVISRGELVEIGGGFRIPDVMRQSGAVLREVGTTNRTRIADYTASVSPATAMFLRVHPSNFRIEGFTERPALADLVAAARAVGMPVVEDIGSGCLTDDLAGEPSVQASIAAGVDLVCFSGDKLLGGPQCGIIAGRRALVDRLADASADARAARRQDHVRDARSDAGRNTPPDGRRPPFRCNGCCTCRPTTSKRRAQALAESLAGGAGAWR